MSEELKTTLKTVTSLWPLILASILGLIWVVALEARVSVLVNMGNPGARQEALDEIENAKNHAVGLLNGQLTDAIRSINEREDITLRSIDEQRDDLEASVTSAVAAIFASNVFGEWVQVAPEDFRSPQLAETSGFVTVLGPASTSPRRITIKTGLTDNADEMIEVAQLTTGSQYRESAIAPVRAGTNWMVDALQGTSTVVLWIPVLTLNDEE